MTRIKKPRQTMGSYSILGGLTHRRAGLTPPANQAACRPPLTINNNILPLLGPAWGLFFVRVKDAILPASAVLWRQLAEGAFLIPCVRVLVAR